MLFRAQAVFKLFETKDPPGFRKFRFNSFILFYIISTQIIYIDQIIHSSIRYAKLRAISNFFNFFLYTLYIHWDKCGYDLKWLETRFIYHIHILSFGIKCGYYLENTFHKNLLYPSVRLQLIRPVDRNYPSVRTRVLS